MEGLHGVHQNRRDLTCATPDQLEGRGVHVLQREAVDKGPLATEAGLHAVPPAVVCPGEAHDESTPRVEARKANRGHHRLGAAAVEGDLVELREAAEDLDVFRHDRVEWAEHCAHVLYTLKTSSHPFLVLLITGHIDSVGATHVQIPASVEIAQARSF